ncbi:GDSL-type esterase/lipase family protein [Pseudonocardia sp. TRM90224]|uniref:GDSL-type esterase/lipase family protein n=1 Tax=Pseudonocardia sp. TRM90224 TaxID=2812678 RepID=UPI001E5079CF|nr:GDSL-type esterase/lipase family protein [Pseudonocardia sp. TRM90224]
MPTVLLVVFCLAVGIPLVVAVTPGQEIVAFGQHITVGARPPEPTLAGPARLVQVGNTSLDLERLHVVGPLRPQLTMGPVLRNAAADAVFDPVKGPEARDAAVKAVTDGFVAWYLWGGLALIGFTLAAAFAAAGVRTLVVLRRHSKATDDPWSLADIWAYCRRAAGRMTVVATIASVLAWGVSGGLAYAGAADGLRGVTSLAQLVGAYHLSPDAVGPEVTGYAGAVIGDSRAVRVGGPPVPPGGLHSRADDAACQRSTDSLAAEIGRLLPAQVLNLACPSATVTSGLRGPQEQGGQVVPAQVGVLKQVSGLRFVVVAIGPNDVGWADFLRYCYGVPDCSDQLTQGEFDYRLAAFDRVYGDLLVDLNDLPDRPQVIVVNSYGAFSPGASCPDTRASGYPGLDPTKIGLLQARNVQLNAVLEAGAQKYGFAVARPALGGLCAPGTDGLGPDLQGLADPFPFHPTGVGSLRMASAVVRLIEPPPSR